MDLENLKEKFKHKAEVDVKDINIAIKAVPFLVKQVIKLEEEVKSQEKLIERLKKKIKRQPPPISKGKKNQFMWVIKVDEDSNTILLQFSGIPNRSGAKMCSNAIINMSERLETGFSVISDFRNFSMADISKRTIFYFRKVHYLFIRRKVRFIIRVISQDKKNTDGFSVLPESSNSNLKVFTVTSIEEGKEMIKNLGKHLRK